MSNKYDFIHIIEEKKPKMSKGHKAIADFIINKYDTAVFMTAAQIGEAINVSESTVVRFASSLGYDGFPDFQKHFAMWVKGRMNSVNKVENKFVNSSQSQIIDSVLKNDIKNINNTLLELDPDTFENAVNVLLEARTVYIVGIRTCKPLADLFAFYLNLVRGNVVCVTTNSLSETFEQMIRVNEEDAVVGISFPRYSMRTLKTLEFASDRNAKVINITDSIHSPVCMYSSINLFAKSDSESIVDSMVAPISVLNAFVVAFCVKARDKVAENINVLEDTWNNYQVYINDEIDYFDDEIISDNSEE